MLVPTIVDGNHTSAVAISQFDGEPRIVLLHFACAKSIEVAINALACWPCLTSIINPETAHAH